MYKYIVPSYTPLKWNLRINLNLYKSLINLKPSDTSNSYIQEYTGFGVNLYKSLINLKPSDTSNSYIQEYTGFGVVDKCDLSAILSHVQTKHGFSRIFKW